MGIQLDQINLVVGDMAAMAEFYGRLGLMIRPAAGEWAPHHRSARGAGADLDLDSPEFASVWDAGWPGGAGIVLGFRVGERARVDELHAELVAAGHASQQQPFDAPWGARYAVVTDPDGNAVGIMSPVDDSFRSPLRPPTAG